MTGEKLEASRDGDAKPNADRPPSPESGGSPKSPPSLSPEGRRAVAERKRREARALRDNLRRRKAQKKLRQYQDSGARRVGQGDDEPT